MTYGHWLDQAMAALRAARETAATTRAASHGDAAATFSARNLVYHRLTQLSDQFGGQPRTAETIRAAEHLVNSNARVAITSPGQLMGVGLRAAISGAAPAPASVTGGDLAANLITAADALGLAADVLTSHLGSPNRPARTPDGYSLAIGTGRPGAWADLAQVASDMIDVDRQLPGWLSRARSPRTLRSVYQPTVDRIRWWTRSRYPTILKNIAGQASGESVVRLLDTAPPTEPSAAPRHVSSLRDVADVLNTARAWLHQHPTQMQYAHVLAATRLAVTISAAAARLDPTGLVDATVFASRWSQVARRLQTLTGLDGARPDTLVQELDAAADWLRHPARSLIAGRGQPDAGWRAAQPRLLGSLPGLAAQLDRAVATAVDQGSICVAQSELDLSTSRRGIFYAKARWRKARPSDDQVKELHERLHVAARAPADREHALRLALGDPVALARSAFARSPEPGPTTTPTEPAPATRGRGARRSATR